MTKGIYESLITQSLAAKLKQLPDQEFYINKTPIDKEEAVRVLAMHMHDVIARAFQSIKANKDLILERQIEISNRLIEYLHTEISQYHFTEDLIDSEGVILKAVFSKIDSHYSDMDLRLKEITPASRLTLSELFIGGNVVISFDSEMKKETILAYSVDPLYVRQN